MKKLLAILLALSLLLVPALALGEGEAPEAALVGDWYGELNGLVLKLTLNEDGAYAALIVTQPDDVKAGTWAYADGFVHLDGSLLPDINVLSDDVLKWTAFDIFLRREAPQTYAPAELLPGAALELYAGCWKAQYVGVNGAILPSDAIGNETVLYVEGSDLALTGGLFDETVLEAAYADGVLSWSGDGVALTLALQQDGFLRLTLATDPETVTLYLLPYYVQGLSPEPAE